jgi:hypothetical protein
MLPVGPMQRRSKLKTPSAIVKRSRKKPNNPNGKNRDSDDQRDGNNGIYGVGGVANRHDLIAP